MYQFDTISKFTTGFCLHMIRLDQVNFLSADILNISGVSQKKSVLSRQYKVGWIHTLKYQ